MMNQQDLAHDEIDIHSQHIVEEYNQYKAMIPLRPIHLKFC